jgi:hypothetical protein
VSRGAPRPPAARGGARLRSSRGSSRGFLDDSGEEECSEGDSDEEGRSPEKYDLEPHQKKQRKRLSNGNKFAAFLEGAQEQQQSIF